MPTGLPPGGVAINETAPVAAEGLTVTVKLAELPCVRVPDGPPLSVTVSEVNVALDQALSKLVMLTEPRPVALSKPGVVTNAGVFAFVGSIRTPNWPDVVLLQFVVAPAQATELFPATVS